MIKNICIGGYYGYPSTANLSWLVLYILISDVESTISYYDQSRDHLTVSKIYSHFQPKKNGQDKYTQYYNRPRQANPRMPTSLSWYFNN